MLAETREAAIETIARYARLGGDSCLLDMIGFNSSRTDTTDEMEVAMVEAVLPLLPDERLDVLMRHIAEALVAEAETQRAPAEVA